MRKIVLLLTLLLSTPLFAANVVYKELPLTLVNGLQKNIDSIWLQDLGLKDKVKAIYNEKRINHYLIDSDRQQFEAYFENYKPYWHAIDLNQDGELELVFQGYYEKGDDREYTEIYCLEGTNYKMKYAEIGALLGYKVNPYSGEILLYTHEYPCCESYTHTINTLRLISGTVKSKAKFFIARDKGDMKGNFFPTQVEFPKFYLSTEKEVQVYWSDSIITNDAYQAHLRKLQSNYICTYSANTVYKVLSTRGNWSYIQIIGIPKPEENKSVNLNNLKMLPIFGWIERNPH